jgi:hypothetical protein
MRSRCMNTMHRTAPPPPQGFLFPHTQLWNLDPQSLARAGVCSGAGRTMKVGMAETPASPATSSSSSTSTLMKVTDEYFASSSAKSGAIRWHGPHHVAVKSTTVGPTCTASLNSSADATCFTISQACCSRGRFLQLHGDTLGSEVSGNEGAKQGASRGKLHRQPGGGGRGTGARGTRGWTTCTCQQQPFYARSDQAGPGSPARRAAAAAAAELGAQAAGCWLGAGPHISHVGCRSRRQRSTATVD